MALDSSKACSTSGQHFLSSISLAVVDKIMRKVPLQVLLRWRLVCKGWNQVIMSKRWTSETNLRYETSIPLLLVNCRDISMTSLPLLALTSNDEKGKWIKISIDLKEASHLYKRCELYKPLCSEFLRCTAAGSLGLIFLTRYCASHVDSDFSLIVYNPVTRSLKPLEIPRPDVLDKHQLKKGFLRLAAVIVDKDEQHYKLLFSTVTGGNELTFKTYFVYDSQTCSWKFKLTSAPPFYHIASKVSCNGYLYFLHTSSTVTEVYGGRGIVTSSLYKPQLGIYDAETDRWHGLQPSLMPEHKTTPYFPQLVQHKGAVLYVVLCESEVQRWENEAYQGPLKTWCFFQLINSNQVGPDYAGAPSSSSSSPSPPQLRWLKVREMPRRVFEAFDLYTQEFHDLETGRHDVCCEGQGDSIYFYCVKPVERTSRSSSSSSVAGRAGTTEGVVLLHDFEKNEWTFLRRYPLFDSADVSSVRLESFRPSFMDI